MNAAQRTDRGFSESVQWTILLPALMLCVLGLVQTGIWLHATVSVRHAAAAAAEAEARSGAPAGAARRAAGEVTSAAGLADVTVAVRRAPSVVAVDVTARAPVFFDVGQGTVSAHAVSPVERQTRP